MKSRSTIEPPHSQLIPGCTLGFLCAGWKAYAAGLRQVLIVSLCWVSIAQAHQPFESSTVARVAGGELELSMTLSSEIAERLLKARLQTQAEQQAQREALLRMARECYEVSGDGQVEAARQTFVKFGNGELLLTAIYPWTAPAEALQLRALYLSRLPPGYGGQVELRNASDDLLRTQLLFHRGGETDWFSAKPKRLSAMPTAVVRASPALTPTLPVPASTPFLASLSWPWALPFLLFGGLMLWRRMKRRDAVLLLVLTMTCGEAMAQRQMEKLGRGVVALRSSSTQVYVGWRLLGNDPQSVAFNLYRSANGATAVKLNATPLTATTDYLDTPPNLSTTAYSYSVRPVLGGVEVTDTWANTTVTAFSLPSNPPTRQYIPVPLQPTPDDAAAGVSFSVKFVWVGDFDGDGEYDFAVERSNPSVEARQWLQAYKRDGTLLWQMNMGPNSVDHYNITPGASTIGIGHGDNVTVYDLDGDGKAEVIVRTANGVVFGNGSTLTAPNNEVQYISIIDGLTGLEKARALVPVPASWATQTHMNGQMGIVYADGLRPSLFFHSSNRNADLSFNHVATTWDYRNGTLTQRWTWPFSGHFAEGHQVRFADVDNDGRDEYCDIGHVLKADGSGQLNGDKLTDLVHGDRFHIADIDPDRPGLETFLIQQNNSTGLLTSYHSADKSSIISKRYSASVTDVGRGTVGAFDPGRRGLQYFSTSGGLFDSKGVNIYSDAPFPPETIWWDGALDRELVSTIGSDATSPGIDRFNPANPAYSSRVLTIYTDSNAPGAPYNNYIAYGGRPQFWGDILGDWREELMCVASDNSELRIYTTKIADTPKTGGGQAFRIYTLMHNPQYRIQATTKGYVQSSYVDYYLGYGMTPPPPPFADAKLVWQGSGGTTWDIGSTTAWHNNGVSSNYAQGDTVRFDLAGSASNSVTLTGTLQPGEVNVFSPTDYTFSGGGTLAGAMKLTKSGAGKLTITGAHSFTGSTTIWDGALVMNGTLSSSAVTVWGGTWGGALAAGQTGGRLAGTGQFQQPVVIKSRGAITPGAGMSSAGTLSFTSGLSAEDGATFALDLSNDPSGASNDRIAVTGALSLAGNVTVVVNPLSAPLAAGTYTLATYSSLSGSLANLSLVVPAGTPATLTADGTAIRLVVQSTRAAGATTWRGTGSTWDLATSQNWLAGSTPEVFVAGDSVTFDTTGVASPSVTLSTALPVSGVNVNSSSDYTLAGSGFITGSGGLSKAGAGTLTVTTANTYTGPTIITGGVLAVNALSDAESAGAIGASTADAANLVLNGGTLRLIGPQTHTNRSATLGVSGAGFDITQASSSLQISGVLSGPGSLTKSGPGTLLLSQANTYSGGTVINGGKVYLAGSIANQDGLGSGSVTINNGTLAMADVQNYDNALWNLIVPAGATARLEADGRCTLSGSLTGAGTLTFYTPFIRTDLRGNWSAFTGQILALGEFRIGNSFGYGNAALDLAAGVAAAYIDNPPTTGRTIDIGELSGAATSMLKGGPTSGRTVTYRIGGRNTSSTFAGEIRDGTGPTALTKLGTGTLTLTGASTYTGTTTVQAGKLKILGSIASSSSLTVAAGATVEMSGTASTSYTGTLTNNGLMRIYDATTVSTTGAFINNGTLDLINFSGTLPANLQNNGTILVAASVKVLSSTRSGSTFNLRVLCYPGHTYTLQTTTNLSGASWTDVTGTEYSPTADTEHVFVDSAPGTNARFYRVRVQPY